MYRPTAPAIPWSVTTADIWPFRWAGRAWRRERAGESSSMISRRQAPNRPASPAERILSRARVSYICTDEIGIPGRLAGAFDHPALPAVGRGCRNLDRPVPVQPVVSVAAWSGDLPFAGE